LKNLFRNIQSITIVVLLIIILFLRECQGTKITSPSEEGTVVKIETKYDTIVKTLKTYVPEYRTEVKWRIRTIHDTIEVHDTIPIDTLSILEDYFKAYAYADTLAKDSVTFIINDTITQNKIISRGIKYSLVYPTTIISKESAVNKRELYIGAGLGLAGGNFNNIGGELILKTKKQTLYGIGFGLTVVDINLVPTISGKMYWKIKMPKIKKPTITDLIDPTIK
jgi:hypothetical protein|tara:strand:+ start:1466 stop:2134 length:669 start_codon:yes stop_codon:yes gene_type:complete